MLSTRRGSGQVAARARISLDIRMDLLQRIQKVCLAEGVSRNRFLEEAAEYYLRLSPEERSAFAARLEQP